MPQTRRTLLTAIGGLAVGFATIGTTGAFDMVELERSASVSITDDTDGYLAIEPHDSRGEESDLVGYDEDGLIELTVEDTALNDDAKTWFHNVFTVTNNGSQEVDLTVTGWASGGTEIYDGFNVYVGDDPEDDDDMPIPAGDVIHLGVMFDTTTLNSPSALEAIHFEAQST